jgi:FKBP-type peptidyl-prolyl cis-trans isomerase FklB
MPKPFTTVVTATAVGIVLLGNVLAHQTPAANPQQSPASEAQKTPAFKTPKDKLSYAIGMNVGTSLHRESIEVDPNLVRQGLEDALSGRKTLLTEEEARGALGELQGELRKKQQEKMKEAGGANKTQGEAFLAANKGKDGVVTLPSGLQYKVLTPGTGPKPTASDSVVCNYRGTLIDGKEFDSSYKRGEAATFPVSGVIKGWTEALQLMPVGSKWQLVVPPTLAYGEQGMGADIGPNATLIFEVELLSIESKDDKDKK